MIQFMTIIMLHYNHSTIMQYFYIGMAIRRVIYTINAVFCSQNNAVNLNIIAVIINLQNQFAINSSHDQFSINTIKLIMQLICS